MAEGLSQTCKAKGLGLMSHPSKLHGACGSTLGESAGVGGPILSALDACQRHSALHLTSP